MAHYSYLSPISVVLENREAHFHVGCLCLEPLKKKSSLILIMGRLFAALSLFGSKGSAQSLGKVTPELLRSFQARERSRPWCSLPKRSHFSSRHHCLRVKCRENGSPFPTVPGPHGCAHQEICPFLSPGLLLPGAPSPSSLTLSHSLD